jgi:hypothetical protein
MGRHHASYVHDEGHRNVVVLFLVILPGTQHNCHIVVGQGRTRSQSQPREPQPLRLGCTCKLALPPELAGMFNFYCT